MAQYAVTNPFSVVSSDEKKFYNMRTLPQDIWDSVAEPRKFFSGRVAPVARDLTEVLYGRDLEKGRKLSDTQLVGEALRSVMPISLQAFGPTMVHNFLPPRAQIFVQQFHVGDPQENFNESLYRAIGIKGHREQTPAEQLSSTRMMDHLPTGIENPDQILRLHRKYEAEDAIRDGKTPDLLGFSPKEIRDIMHNGHEDQLVSRFGRLDLGDALDVYKIATAEERQRRNSHLIKKAQHYVGTLSVPERREDTNYQRLVNMGLPPRLKAGADFEPTPSPGLAPQTTSGPSRDHRRAAFGNLYQFAVTTLLGKYVAVEQIPCLCLVECGAAAVCAGPDYSPTSAVTSIS